ncbi:MAG: T9SS type A sorting domain-containing protein [Chitinophagales bacterium]|nr:T9SS type A sorting domain-containing protein [Chitinophagales bacterium]
MNFKSTLSILAVAISLQANAQSWVADSVEMGANYKDDIFYDLSNGNDYSATADNWDIAFQMTVFGDPMFNATVRANHIKRDVQVYSLHKQASTSFGTLTASDTVVTQSNQLVNIDTSWGTGAFTNNRGSNPFDYGWGAYNSTTHFLDGDSLYLVKANGVFYQLWLKQYVSFGSPGSVGYKFRVALWDGTGDRSDSVMRVSPYDDRLFAYYDLATGTIIDREPARKNWHLLFKQYQKNGQPGGQNPNKLQAYTGVLVNDHVKVAKITGVSPNNINSGNYTSSLSALSVETNTIGDDWKTFNGGTFMYELDTNTSFIIAPDTAGGKQTYYHLRFTRFDGGFAPNTGKVIFETRVLGMISVGVNDVTGVSKAQYSIYPNPSATEVNIVVDAKEAVANTMMVVTDITGKVMQQSRVNITKGLNAYKLDVAAYPAGTYIVTVANSNWSVSDKVSVQH